MPNNPRTRASGGDIALITYPVVGQGEAQLYSNG
jgi:hypothetical protein